jgi:uncharacterized membrane protein YadS
MGVGHGIGELLRIKALKPITAEVAGIAEKAKAKVKFQNANCKMTVWPLAMVSIPSFLLFHFALCILHSTDFVSSRRIWSRPVPFAGLAG